MKELILHPSLQAVLFGLMGGLAAGLVADRLLKLGISDSISKQNAAAGMIIPLQIVRLMLMGLPMLLGCLFPEVLSVLGAFGGEMIAKLVLFFCETAGKGRNGR